MLATNFNRLALYLAYRAGHVTWAQLPLTTQVACVQASSAASLTAYAATLTPATKAATTIATMRTGGMHLTNPALPTVAPHTASRSNALQATANMRKVA